MNFINKNKTINVVVDQSGREMDRTYSLLFSCLDLNPVYVLVLTISQYNFGTKSQYSFNCISINCMY